MDLCEEGVKGWVIEMLKHLLRMIIQCLCVYVLELSVCLSMCASLMFKYINLFKYQNISMFNLWYIV